MSISISISISIGLYPNLDLWNANKLHYITSFLLNTYLVKCFLIPLVQCSPNWVPRERAE